jgi:hypothetical protein
MKATIEFTNRDKIKEALEKEDEQYVASRAILEFSLPDCQSDLELALDGLDWYCVVWDLEAWLRNEVKYNYKKHDDSTLDAFDIVRQKIREYMSDRKLRFE